MVVELFLVCPLPGQRHPPLTFPLDQCVGAKKNEPLVPQLAPLGNGHLDDNDGGRLCIATDVVSAVPLCCLGCSSFFLSYRFVGSKLCHGLVPGPIVLTVRQRRMGVCRLGLLPQRPTDLRQRHGGRRGRLARDLVQQCR